MTSERLKGNLKMLLLAAIAEAPAHGYEVIRRLATTSDGTFNLKEGTIYPVLHALEKDGLLTADWVDVDGRPRKVYSITGQGSQSLAAERESWSQFERAVQKVVGGPQWTTS